MWAVRRELKESLLQARIDRIYQPWPDTILINLRRQSGERYKLLLSAHPRRARVHLTTETLANPPHPSMFCMVLRKHLEGGRIADITQKGLERQLTFHIEAFNELREPSLKQLICEIMGKHSNIILINPATKQILDGMKRYSRAVSRYREVLPGSTYLDPPPQNKLDPRLISQGEFQEKLLEKLDRKVSSALVDLLAGISPLLAGEIVFRAGLPEDIRVEYCGAYDLDILWQSLQKLTSELFAGRFRPTLVRVNGSPHVFSAADLTSYPEESKIHPATVNETVDLFHRELRREEEFQARQKQLQRLVKKQLEKCWKKASLQEDAFLLATKAQELKIKGEILAANLYRIEKGKKLVTLENFYDPNGALITIKLEPDLTASQNVQNYFKQYTKAKNAATKARKQYENTKEEIQYLQSVAHSLDEASSISDLEEIARELHAQGYIKESARPVSSGQKKTAGKPTFLQAVSSDGYSIFIGKNNHQNDHLTLKVARDRDMWFHVKEMAGSHVIVQNPRGSEIPARTITEAAILAAYFSKGQQSSRVPVDYTEKRYVRKPKGAKPGMVVYEKHRTIYVTPEKDLVHQLLIREEQS